MATMNFKCKGCQRSWWLPKEGEFAFRGVAHCQLPQCPYINENISWLKDKAPVIPHQDGPKIVEIGKPKRHYIAEVDDNAPEKYPEMVRIRQKFK